MRKRRGMRLPNNYGGIVNLGKRRRKPFAVRITIGWDDKGRQIYKYLGYFEKREHALQALADFNKAPYDINARKMTLEEVWNEWEEGHSQKVSKSSMSVYRSAWRKMERLHRMQMSELRASHFQAIVDDNKESASVRMVKVVAGLLYRHAMKIEAVDQDHSAFIELPKQSKKKEKTPFSDEEIKSVMEKVGDRHADMVAILLYTGMRVSELLEMRTENIDLDNRIMVGGLKTEAGKDRKIPIHKKIVPIIERNIGKEYLFSSPRGGKYHYSNEGMAINRWLKKNGLSHTIHETRHTFISQAKRIGLDDLTLKRIVGHSTKDITEHYAHKLEQDLLNAIDDFRYEI
jgi:integrase